MNDRDIERIAKDILGLETLETRNSDALDFKEQAVWNIKKALEEAFMAGYADGVFDGAREAADYL